MSNILSGGKVNARDFLKLSYEEVLGLEDKWFEMAFDDGVKLQVNTRSSIFSWICWELHRKFPQVPLNHRNHLVGLVGRDEERIKFRTGADSALISECLKDTYVTLSPNVDMVELKQLIYLCTNSLWNLSCLELGSYVTTVNIFDFLEIALHPELQSLKKEMEDSPDAVDAIYSKSVDIVHSKDKLSLSNTVRRSTIVGASNDKQMLQGTGARGLVTDIDSTIFPKPIIRSFVEGFTSLYDMLIESRSGSKALMANMKPLQEAQYFNRRMQLGSSVFKTLHRGDCGDTEGMYWQVSEDDLTVIEGKIQILDDGSLRPIKRSDKHLIGELIKLRMVHKCRHEDQYGCCETCFGLIAASIPGHVNVGHFSAVELCADISQLVISTKHHDASSKADELFLTEESKLAFSNMPGQPAYIAMNKGLKDRDVALIFPVESLGSVSDVVRVDDVSRLIESRTTEISKVTLMVDEIEVTNRITLGGTSRRPALSRDMLQYLKDHGWENIGSDEISVNMGDWDYSKPVFRVPLKQQNMIDVMVNISTMVEGRSSNNAMVKPITRYKDEGEAIRDLNIIVNDKVKVNIAFLEVVIRTTSVKSIKGKDHSLSTRNGPVEFAASSSNLLNRSKAAHAAYQNQHIVFNSARSYLQRNSIDHPTDDLLVPKE